MSNLEIISEAQLHEVSGGDFGDVMGYIMWVAMGCPPGYDKKKQKEAEAKR